MVSVPCAWKSHCSPSPYTGRAACGCSLCLLRLALLARALGSALKSVSEAGVAKHKVQKMKNPRCARTLTTRRACAVVAIAKTVVFLVDVARLAHAGCAAIDAHERLTLTAPVDSTEVAAGALASSRGPLHLLEFWCTSDWRVNFFCVGNAKSSTSEISECWWACMTEYTYKRRPLSAAERRQRVGTERLHGTRVRLGLLLGKVARRIGTRKAARLARVSHSTVDYWKQKAVDARLHPGTWGGHRARTLAFGSDESDLAVQRVVLAAIEDEPDISFRALLLKLRAVPGLRRMSTWWLSTTIKSWNWNWASSRVVPINKYSDQNINAWVSYAVRVLDIPLDRVRCVVELTRLAR